MGKQNEQRFSQALKDIRAGLDATALSSIAQDLATVEKEFTTVTAFASSNLSSVDELNEKNREIQKELDSLKLSNEELNKQIKENDSSERITNLTYRS